MTSSGYGAPFWTFFDCHISARRHCFKLTNVRQGYITKCVLYNEGNNASIVASNAEYDPEGQYASFATLTEVADFDIGLNKCYYQETGKTNSPNGFIIVGTAKKPSIRKSDP